MHENSGCRGTSFGRRPMNSSILSLASTEYRNLSSTTSPDRQKNVFFGVYFFFANCKKEIRATCRCRIILNPPPLQYHSSVLRSRVTGTVSLIMPSLFFSFFLWRVFHSLTLGHTLKPCKGLAGCSPY